jgi:hypothetical protein
MLASQFIRDASNHTIIDTKTNLHWQDNSAVKDTARNYADSLTYCHDLTLAGFSDWRMPNINELLSISDYSRNNPSINPIFVNVKDSLYWSSTPIKNHNGYIWAIDFTNCDDKMEDKDNSNYVRCVRSNY